MLWEWGAYFTKEAIEEGLDVKVSTWARNAPNTTPAMAKSVANYANAQLIKMEAIVDGYAEGIALDTHGNLSEGSGQNVFIVRDGIIYTPPIGLVGALGHHARFGDDDRTRPRIRGARVRRCRAKCCTSRTRCSSLAPPSRSRRSGPSTA